MSNTKCAHSDNTRSLITIIVCRFILEIRELHSRPGWTSRFHESLPLSDFKAATGNADAQNVARNEFDDDFVKESVFALFGTHLGEIAVEENAVLAAAPPSETIALQELPPVASSSRNG